MRLSKSFMPTRKEDPADAEIASHKLLVRGGYIRQVARGIYDYLPLGLRSLRKIKTIIREEMDRSGAQEVLLPAVQPAELWQESGRWDEYGPELLRMKDRKGGDFCLGPTHEEVITAMVRGEINSYKQLPQNIYQIQDKFRDEPRPRFGLLRAREFSMKDAYSFDIDEEAAEQSYDEMYETYARICDRLGFEWRAVEAPTGAIGGSRSHEFQVIAETGEDELVHCAECDYAANVEIADVDTSAEASPETGDEQSMETVDTPEKRTIEEVSEFLDVEPARCVKTLIYLADDEPVAVLMRGDHEANDIKVDDFLTDERGLEYDELHMANDAAVRDVTGAPVGFAGPVELDIPVFADRSIEGLTNVVVGANAADEHHTNVNWGRDVDIDAFGDFRKARAGDPCPACGAPLDSSEGIEVGHVFFLGTKYSEPLGATVQDEHGVDTPMVMGCYGMGVSRILAAVAEQNHDEDGLVWPMPIAPFQALVMPLQMGADEVVETAESLYEELEDRGIEVAIDDRDEGIGSKFADSELIGFPIRIAIGTRGLDDGNVEVQLRWEDDHELVPVDEAADVVSDLVDEYGADVDL